MKIINKIQIILIAAILLGSFLNVESTLAYNPGTTFPFDNQNPAVSGADPSGVQVTNPNTQRPVLGQVKNLNDVILRAVGVANVVLYCLVALAVVFIVYHIVWYVIRPSSPDDKKTHGVNIIWGLVGLFIIVSLWGLVGILVRTFNTDNTVPRENFPNVDFINKK
jgi:hypothetical protein